MKHWKERKACEGCGFTRRRRCDQGGEDQHIYFPRYCGACRAMIKARELRALAAKLEAKSRAAYDRRAAKAPKP